MAQSRASSVIPSAGVLAAAAAAAVLAAILVNVYMSIEIDKVTAHSVRILVLRENLQLGDIITDAHLKEAAVPAYFKEAFARAVKPEDRDRVRGKKAPRPMYAGEPLYYAQFLAAEGGERYVPRKGYELMFIPIDARAMPSGLLQPGTYVSIYADFDMNPDPKVVQIEPKEVMTNACIRDVDEKSGYGQIGIELATSQALKLRHVMKVMKSRTFAVNLLQRPERPGIEPQVNEEVLNLLRTTPAGTTDFPPD